MVDRLLASPHYGERWGRHWLDVARYADTKGYVFTEERRYPFAYTYRDYVIRRLQRRPALRPVRPRAARRRPAADSGDDNTAAGGDGLPDASAGGSSTTSTTSSTTGSTWSARGLLGLTVSCARCHDHKFDPIPTEDYYSLYGVFASSVEPDDCRCSGMPQQTPRVRGVSSRSSNGPREDGRRVRGRRGAESCETDFAAGGSTYLERPRTPTSDARGHRKAGAKAAADDARPGSMAAASLEELPGARRREDAATRCSAPGTRSRRCRKTEFAAKARGSGAPV